MSSMSVGAPTAKADSYTVRHDRVLSVRGTGVLANDTDPQGLPLQALLATEPLHGEVLFQSGDQSFGGKGTFNYIPDPGFVGTDSFTYTATNGTAGSAAATVTITVTNQTPVGAADAYELFEDQALRAGGTGGTPSVLANDTDADSAVGGEPLQAVLVSNVTHGALVLREDGSFTYTPDPNFVGTDTFTYRAWDGIADSPPTTATIVVKENGLLDIDGKDRTTAPPWMPEPDESLYGMQTGTGGGGTILLHPPLPPAGSGWQLVGRSVGWDPATLTVGGVGYPGEINLPLTGDITYPVAATRSGYRNSTIEYEAAWYNPTRKPAQSLVGLVVLKVVERKAVLKSVEFTTDDKALLTNSKDIISVKDSVRFNDIEFVPATATAPKYNAPFSHTRDKAVTTKVTFNAAGLAGDQVKVAGASNTAAFVFESATQAAGDGDVTVEITGKNKLPKEIGSLSGEIDWTLVVNPGANPVNLPMGKSGPHKVYITYGAPRVPVGADSSKPTEARMELATTKVGEGYKNAKGNVKPGAGDPKPVQIVYETIQTLKVDLNNGIVGYGKTDQEKALGWKVPSNETGGDCISELVQNERVLAPQPAEHEMDHGHLD
ncbi:MAG: cadherin-like domain-containing protein, partial [Gemmataceae bacterium]|nr:cadherin-like domain-containing protein [Gemmataceae bacterium]